MPTAGLANDIEVKFQSAVELVRSLPQKGSFQPSYNDASKVYGYYKQAKFGPCSHSRPSFWDVVGRAKWDAWNALGEMPEHEAMENYVNEIKKLFESLTAKEEFQTSQREFSHAIVPFCEANDLEVPDALVEHKKSEKKRREKKKVEDALKKSTGSANGHGVQNEGRNKDILVEIKGDCVKLVTGNGQNIVTDRNGENGSVSMEDEAAIEDNTFDDGGNAASLDSFDKESDLQAQAVTMEMSSYIDAESSDDDVYCDSINPDEVSGVSRYGRVKTGEIESQMNTDNGITITTDSTSSPLAHSRLIEGEKGLELKHISSTPDVKTRHRSVEESGHDSSVSAKEVNTDVSTLSSISSDFNETHNAEVHAVKADAGGLEDELKNEFESKVPRHARRPRHRKRNGLKDDKRERHHSDIMGKRNLTVGARGNSQTDLAGSGGESRERQTGSSVQQHEGPSRPTSGQPSQRLRRANADSSSDSSQSSKSATSTGETIGEQIVKALGKLEHDMRQVLLRLNSIEHRISAVSDAVNRRPWWAAYLPSRRYMFLLFWPILIHIIFAFWRRRRKK